MDTTDPEITFDESGNCCHCTEFLDKRSRHAYQGKTSDEALEKMVDEIKRSGRRQDHDCVIGVSGGADSCYLAHVAVQRGLRPLTVHMDNGWNSDKAVLNIKSVTEKLGIDYESYVLDWEEFKDLQLAFLKASVPEAETPTDVAIPAALHHVAAKRGIKYILSGGNLATEGILPKSWHYDVKDLKYFNHIHQKFGRKKLRTFPTFGYKREIYYKLVRGIRTLYPLDFVPFVKEDAIKLLEREFDWHNYGGKHHESRYTKFIQSYYLYEKFQIDYRRPGMSIQICANQLDRDTANEVLRSKPYDPETIGEDKRYISKKLGISSDEFEAILNKPPKWYWDYPTEEKKLAFIYDTYRTVFKKEKLDRF
jgi:N-acetyl sugar amidotransferase